MIKVTFDSNVWQRVSSPHEYPDEASIECFRKIHAAVKAGKVAAYIAEVVFTLEALKRNDRQSFMRSYKAKIDGAIDEMPRQDGMIGLTISISSDIKAHPGNNPDLYKYLKDALDIGFKIISCPRVGAITNPDIDQSFFVQESDDENLEKRRLCDECDIEIRRLGGGISHAMQLGNSYSTGSDNWFTGIKNAPPTEANAKKIAKVLAEWADGDAIAAHVGYKNDYFCTRDEAKKAGTSSVFSPKNRASLKSKFGVKFVSPENLCHLIV
ncbi:MAG: hypothetical protein M3458_09805 [Acidobacteriota bacterium]|nr:hypothetical protein [Acidobacteriota bacterium]